MINVLTSNKGTPLWAVSSLQSKTWAVLPLANEEAPSNEEDEEVDQQDQQPPQ